MSVSKARSTLAVKAKRAKRDPSPEATAEVASARRELGAAKLEAYIQRVVRDAEPLSAEQLQRLSLLLRGRPETKT